LSFDLGGGRGGLAQFFKHLGPDLEAVWKVLGDPHLDDATIGPLIHQVDQSYGARPAAQLASDRDRRQLAILGALASAQADGG
jgi:ketoreductase RED1